MTDHFDLVTIGSGSAASTVASRCRAAGWGVAIVDSLPFGGTCARRGCDPKKVLVGAAEVIDWARRMEGRGTRAEGARIEWPDLMRFKRTFTEPVAKAREESFARAGIVALRGPARFIGPNTLRVGARELAARHVVIATGARPASLPFPGAEHLLTSDDFLELEVNEFLQSVSNPAVYAAGDAAQTDGMPLTPVAGYEGGIVAANLLEGNRHTADYAGVPSVVFTIPPLASVGLKEHEARERGLRFRIAHQQTSGWYSSRRVAEDCSGFKVLIEEPGGRILGAHLLGPQADELANLFALAIRKGLRAADLKETLFAYPTHASDLAYMVG